MKAVKKRQQEAAAGILLSLRLRGLSPFVFLGAGFSVCGWKSLRWDLEEDGWTQSLPVCLKTSVKSGLRGKRRRKIKRGRSCHLGSLTFWIHASFRIFIVVDVLCLQDRDGDTEGAFPTPLDRIPECSAHFLFVDMDHPSLIPLTLKQQHNLIHKSQKMFCKRNLLRESPLQDFKSVSSIYFVDLLLSSTF